jgi:hypothetical protein
MLSVCGLRDGIEKFGHFCIDTRLAAAPRRRANGLFFRGREALPFGTAIRSVRDLLELLLTGRVAEPAANRPMFYARLIDIKMKKDPIGRMVSILWGSVPCIKRFKHLSPPPPSRPALSRCLRCPTRLPGDGINQGDVLVRLRAISIQPNERGSDTLGAINTGVNNAIVPELDFTYMIRDYLGSS